MVVNWYLLLLIVISLSKTAPNLASRSKSREFGARIGHFKAYSHGIKGTVYAADDHTILIKNFHFDGIGPAAYFFAGNTAKPSPRGIVLSYPQDYVGRDSPSLTAENGTDVILVLPEGKKLRDFRWLTVWCARFTLNYAEVFIPANLDVPQPRMLSEFKRFAHGLKSGNITIVDSKSFYIPNLHYDGLGPDAFFWVGNGSEPSPIGVKVPNEYGSLERLKEYAGQDIEIMLPHSLTVYNIDWLAIWCIRYRHNFGHIMIPKDLDVPPSLGRTRTPITADVSTFSSTTSSRLNVKKKMLSNCMNTLNERLQVRWGMPKKNHILVQLTAVIRPDQYIAFGISGEPDRPAMVGSDVTVVYYDQSILKFQAIDYYISATSQCTGTSGVCSDETLGGNNDVILVRAARFEDVVNVFYMKPIITKDIVYDKPIPIGTKISVIAAIGPLNSKNEPSMHGLADKTTENVEIDFGTVNENSCDVDYSVWQRSMIFGETIFQARLGPSELPLASDTPDEHEEFGNVRDSLGLVWYINKKMIPEIYVERGRKYTFIVEGGSDPLYPKRYHPLYITDSPVGGFAQMSNYERKDQRVFAGINYDSDGDPFPTTAGRYCEWEYVYLDESESDTLEEYCEKGEPSYLEWTVDPDTPDIVYYQCYTHQNLGWKIYVQNQVYDDHATDNKAALVFQPEVVLLVVTVVLSLN